MGSSIDLDYLEALARAATPNTWPWEFDGDYVNSNDGGIIAETGTTHGPYIAALSPDVVLELIGELRRLNRVLEDIAMNTSTAMPYELNDEIEWYRSQLMSCIGRAARGMKK